MNPLDFITKDWFGLGMAGLNYFTGQDEYNEALERNQEDFDKTLGVLDQSRTSGLNSLRLGGKNAIGSINTGFNAQDRILSQLLGTNMSDLGNMQNQIGSLLGGISKTGQEQLAARTQGVREGYGGISDQYRSDSNDILGRLRGSSDDLNARYDQRTGSILSRLKGLGDQARSDIGERVGETTTTAVQNASARGLSGTGAIAGIRSSIAREGEKEFARLEEQLRREKIGTEASLTGEALGARERGRNVDAATASNLSQFGAGLGQRGTDAIAAALGQEIEGGINLKRAKADFARDMMGTRMGLRSNIQGARAAGEVARGGAKADIYSRFAPMEANLLQDNAMARTGIMERAFRPVPQDPRDVFQGQLNQIISGRQQRQFAQAQQPSFWDSFGGPLIQGGATAAGTLLGGPLGGAAAGAATGNYGPLGVPLDYRTGYTTPFYG